MEKKSTYINKFLNLLKYEKHEIYSIYFYAVLGGLVQLSLPLGIQSIISFVIGGAISTSLVLLIIFVIVGVFIAGLLQINQMKLIEKIQQQLFVRYAFQYADIIPKFDLKSVDGYYLPELVNRFVDTVSLQKSVSKLLLDIPAATIQIIFGLILLSFYHPVFILFGVLLLSVLYLILISTGNRGMETSLQESDYKYKVLGYLQELARFVTTFKFSRNTAHHLVKTDEYVTGYLQARTAHFRILLFQYWALIAFKLLITASMLIVGAILLVDQQLNIGQFIATEIVILLIISSVEKLILNLDKAYDVMTSIEKITKVIEKPMEPNGNKILPVVSEGLSIKAEKLSFSYQPGKPVLNNISFDIQKGAKVCIQGVNGSGKSTLLRLLTGAYPSFEGNLSINNIPMHSLDLHSFRSQIGILLNGQELFHGTLYENICLGEKDISYQELDKLASITGLKQFVSAHKMGFDMPLQPGGQQLSGRIIKKILLMRALTSHPRLLLLEEPWLGLEETYQHSIRKYLLDELSDTTVLVISDEEAFASMCDTTILLQTEIQ